MHFSACLFLLPLHFFFIYLYFLFSLFSCFLESFYLLGFVWDIPISLQLLDLSVLGLHLVIEQSIEESKESILG